MNRIFLALFNGIHVYRHGTGLGPHNRYFLCLTSIAATMAMDLVHCRYYYWRLVYDPYYYYYYFFVVVVFGNFKVRSS